LESRSAVVLTKGPLEFAGEEAWKARLAELRITNERHVRIATEGTLLGGLIDRGVSPNLIVLSDGALQFVILLHAACWIHAERPLIKMVPHNDEHRAVIEAIRGQIWELYKAPHGPRRRTRVRADTRFSHESAATVVIKTTSGVARQNVLLTPLGGRTSIRTYRPPEGGAAS
jgi:hypothetical protein